VLLAIDVGNTETVIGLYSRDEADPVPDPEESVGVGIGIERDPTAPAASRTTGASRRSAPALPMSTRSSDQQLLDLEGSTSPTR